MSSDIIQPNILSTEQIAIERFAQMSFANLTKNMVQDLKNNRKESVLFKKYPIETVVKMLENPSMYEKELREMSNFLYIVSSHYRRLINHYAEIPTYNYNVFPSNLSKKINKKTYKETYNKVITQVDKYNVKYEIPKIMISTLLEGVFYGLTYETSDSFYIKQFNSKYAEISFTEDGVCIYAMDLNYFYGKEYLLDSYGEEIKLAYYRYRGDPNKKIIGNPDLRWYEPSNGICIKADETNLLFSVPVFCSIFLDVYRLEDYKLLKKAKTEIDNYKVLAMKMECDENGAPKMDWEVSQKYYHQAANNIPSGIGLILSPFDITDFSFQKSATSEQDAVHQAEDGFWTASGTSPLLFGSAKATSSSSLSLSTKPDEQMAFAILKKVCKFFNSRIKSFNYPYSFSMKFLDQSIFNATEVQNQLQKAATYGVTGTKLLYASSLGMTPCEIANMAFLENEILDVTGKMFTSPLISSNTMSPDAQPTGAPTAEEKGDTVISESNEQTRNNDSNKNKI